MARQDIVTAIKNAVERGFSIEQAKATLINSGYSKEDVDSAANYLTSGVGNLEPLQQPAYTPQETMHEQEHEQTQQLPQTQQPPMPQINQTKKPQKGQFPWKVFVLVIVLVILLALLGFMLVFRENVTGFLETLIGG